MNLFKSLSVICVLAISLAACGPIDDPTKNWTPKRFYKEAKEAMDDGDYETAISHFETLESRYPYGRYAVQAQMEIAYAYYKQDEPALATAAAERFIRQHPTYHHVDYAYYLKGLISFPGKRNIISWLMGGKDDIADRDPRTARDSYNAFRELVERFPDSRYAPDSRQRIIYLLNTLATYETKVANYYFNRGAYVAAVNRTKYVLENYQRTPAVEDALGIQAQAYTKMGLNDLSHDSLRVLKKNFPNSQYLSEIPTQDESIKQKEEKTDY
jgi:outer membrane protein assembly factor BamD